MRSRKELRGRCISATILVCLCSGLNAEATSDDLRRELIACRGERNVLVRLECFDNATMNLSTGSGITKAQADQLEFPFSMFGLDITSSRSEVIQVLGDPYEESDKDGDLWMYYEGISISFRGQSTVDYIHVERKGLELLQSREVDTAAVALLRDSTDVMQLFPYSERSEGTEEGVEQIRSIERSEYIRAFLTFWTAGDQLTSITVRWMVRS